MVGHELAGVVGLATTATTHARIETHAIAEIAVLRMHALAVICNEPKVELIATTTAAIAVKRLALWRAAVLPTHGT